MNTKGKSKVLNLHTQGYVRMADVVDWNFIYESSTVKDSRFEVGDRVVLPDGREFRYAKSGGACYAGQGVDVRATYVQTIDNIAAAAAVGATQITVDGGTHAALAENELRNGFVCIFGDGNNDIQFRGIIGNDAADADADFTIYLDGPLAKAVTTSTNCEVYRSPWSDVRLGSAITNAKAGVAAVEVTAAGVYFWVQTAGCCWIAPQSGVGGTQYRTGYWRHDGSIDISSNIGTYVSDQAAGFCVMGNAAGVGPLFALGGKI